MIHIAATIALVVAALCLAHLYDTAYGARHAGPLPSSCRVWINPPAVDWCW